MAQLNASSACLKVRATGRARDAISAVLALKPATAVLASTGVHAANSGL